MLYEQDIRRESLVRPHHGRLTLPNLHWFVQLTKLDSHHTHVWALCLIYLSSGNRNIPPHECDLHITTSAQLHTGRWVTEKLPVCFFTAVLARLALTSKAKIISISLFLFFPSPPIYAATAHLWLFGVKSTHFRSALLSFFQLGHTVTNILRCWAPSRSGLQGTRVNLISDCGRLESGLIVLNWFFKGDLCQETSLPGIRVKRMEDGAFLSNFTSHLCQRRHPKWCWRCNREDGVVGQVLKDWRALQQKHQGFFCQKLWLLISPMTIKVARQRFGKTSRMWDTVNIGCRIF